MSEATFNFRLQTLLDEIEMHDHKDELIALLQEQVSDDTYINNKYQSIQLRHGTVASVV